MKTFRPLLYFLTWSISSGFISARAAEATVNEGSVITISYGLGAGTPPFTQQWFKDGKPIPNATGEKHVIASATAADAGNYTVRVENRAGPTTSDIAGVTIIVRPSKAVTAISTATPTI